MTVRRLALLAGVLAAAGCSQGSAPAGGPAPRPVPRPSGGPQTAPRADPTKGAPVLYQPAHGVHYILDRRDSLTLELPGGATQVQPFGRTAYLSVGVGEAPGGYRASIRLDSLRQESGGTVAPDSVLRAEGTGWTAPLSPQGRLGPLVPDRLSAVGDQIGASLTVLFPVLPATGVQNATGWTDTTERSIRADAFDARERAITEYRVVSVDGGVYVIDATGTFARTGTGGDSTQPLEMASSGTRRATYRFAAQGLVVAAEGADSAEMTITVPALGQTVPVHQRASWRLQRQ